MAPSSNLEANYLNSNLYTNFEANISPSRAGAPMHADALDAQMNYTREHHNSGGGRTEETRDRVNQQQIDRSRISNRTRARGTEIAAGTTSADGWTTFPAKRQVAAIEMRVGQHGGPLPSEASFDFGEPIVYFLSFAHGPSRRAFFATKPGLLRTKRWIRRLQGKIKGVFCNKVYVTQKFWNNFLDKENREGGANNLVFQFRGTSNCSKGNGQIDGRATFGWINGTRDRRRGQAKHQPNTVLRPRGTRLVEGLGQERRASVASASDWSSVTRERRREQAKHQPTTVLRPRGTSPVEGLGQKRRASVTPELQTSIDMQTSSVTAEPKVTMMDGFEKRRMHGSIQSAGTDDVSSAQQMKFFEVAVNNMRHTQMVMRVHVPEQNVDISLFHGADQLSAKKAMAEEINERLGALLKVPVTPQSIRRSSLQQNPAVAIFMADVTIINQAAGTSVNFKHAMQGLTNSGGSLRTLTGHKDL